jgi:hypothetical protein
MLIVARRDGLSISRAAGNARGAGGMPLIYA